MNDSLSKDRAAMPSGTNAVLDKRSLAASNANLLTVLSPGQTVLDAGCGSGAITHGIAGITGPTGTVIGIDRSEALIQQAADTYSNIKNLHFVAGDILDYNPPYLFDVITTARTLQWVANPQDLIRKMKTLLKPNGLLCVLDYDHTAITWQPQPPASMQFFYEQFLKWRSDAGMDNQIAIHTGDIMKEYGLEICYNADHSEYHQQPETGFLQHVNIWAVVAETRGKQMVADGYVSEAQRIQAASEYKHWCDTEAQSMRLVLRGIHGRNN
ncbi:MULTISPECIES: class I SAM-dependent methyltransferase [Niastella]|uniref:Class I SAM-dependent methyltransferase n=1 Tax=Niastella soli TaxID=2821487 RepID=A0ABS3YLA9_9BACT|nr:class I SAM-dependent methyltransferase [Niastella soli]MBO9198682.1 class I SAM-dependent methyltransferase [Niastella soli]